MGRKIELEITERDGMFLREHVGEGEATAEDDPRTFTLSRGYGLPTLFVDVEGADGEDRRSYIVAMGQKTVEAVLDYDAELRQEERHVLDLRTPEGDDG